MEVTQVVAIPVVAKATIKNKKDNLFGYHGYTPSDVSDTKMSWFCYVKSDHR